MFSFKSTKLEKTAKILKIKIAQIGYKNFQQLVSIRTAFNHLKKIITGNNYDYIYTEDIISNLGKNIDIFINQAYYKGVSSSQSSLFIDKINKLLKNIDSNIEKDTPDSSFYMRYSNLKDQISKFLPETIQAQHIPEPTYEFEEDEIKGTNPNV